MAEAMYKTAAQQQAGAQPGAGAGGPQGGPQAGAGNGSVDADFTVVDEDNPS